MMTMDIIDNKIAIRICTYVCMVCNCKNQPCEYKFDLRTYVHVRTIDFTASYSKRVIARPQGPNYADPS